MSRLDRLLSGSYPRLPGPVDWCSEQWAALRPRVRMLAVLTLIVAAAMFAMTRVQAAEQRWGGTPRRVLIATRDLAVGDPATSLRMVRLPPDAVPDTALSQVGVGVRVTLALPAGAVLTSAHIDPRGPAAGLGAGLRAMPIRAEEGWGVVSGGWVDVWVLGDAEGGSRLVAQSRPVVEVRRDTGGLTALVGLAEPEVAATTAAIGTGGVLLAHAPPPGPDTARLPSAAGSGP